MEKQTREIAMLWQQNSLAEWSKALASGASPQGRGFEPHSCHFEPSARWGLIEHRGDSHSHYGTIAKSGEPRNIPPTAHSSKCPSSTARAYPLVAGFANAGARAGLRFSLESAAKSRKAQHEEAHPAWLPLLSKLIWLVLGGDLAARSHRVEQFTAL